MTGEPFERFVEDEILVPLGMTTATFFRPGTGLATGYLDGAEPGPYWDLIFRPSGALNASAWEMAALVQLFLGRGRFGGVELFPEASIDRMERAETTLAARAGLPGGYGLGNYTAHHERFLFHGHSGGMNTFVADVGYCREIGRGYFAAMNSADGEAFREIRRLIRAYLTSDQPSPAVPEPEARSSQATPPSLKRFAGYYRPEAPRVDRLGGPFRLLGLMVVEVGGEGMRVRPLLGGEARPLEAVSGDLFRQPQHANATVAFLPATDGERVADGNDPALLQATSGLLTGSYRRVSRIGVWARLGLALAVALAVASSVLFALVWVPRLLLGRLRDSGPLRVRALPLAASLALGASLGALVVAVGDPLERLAKPSLWSIGFCVGGWLLAVLTLAALWGAWSGRREGRRLVRLHSRLVAIACSVATWTLYAWGLLGLRSWSY